MNEPAPMPAASRRRRRSFLRDDGAQAMTEYVIVMPVVLLMCFAALQTVVTSQAVQLADYAAFAAARSYATEYARFERDLLVSNHAKAAYDRAWLVACMITAPISTGVGNESPGSFASLRQAATSDRETQIMQGIMEGLAVAFVFRIENFRVAPLNSNDPRAVVHVSFDYMLPVVLPGFNDIWTYVQNRHHPTELRLADVFEPPNDPFWPGANPPIPEFEVVLRDWKIPPDAGFASTCVTEYMKFVRNPGTGAPISLRIPARCAVGFEPLVGDML